MEKAPNLENYKFRDLHPNVLLGTASDRYAGWIGQVYTEGRYTISRRTNKVGGKSFVEEVLPVESVEEYFEHFSILEIDFTFYRLLLENDGKPTQNYHVLRKYRQHLKEGDLLLLKVPQVIFARKLRRGKDIVENEGYLNPEIFINQFYRPAVEILGSFLSGFIFEQEYQRSKDRTPTDEMAADLDAFFEAVPKDRRYHVELRTEALLSEPIINVFEKHGVGQVLSHWTWLPPLSRQFIKGGQKFFNSARECLIRLITPRGKRYEDTYAQAFPFNALVENMMDTRMVEETVGLMRTAIDQGVKVNIIINNRAGGSAPVIAGKIAERFICDS
jgi:uncharacterized protein YecE (DUF72 family)